LPSTSYLTNQKLTEPEKHILVATVRKAYTLLQVIHKTSQTFLYSLTKHKKKALAYYYLPLGGAPEYIWV